MDESPRIFPPGVRFHPSDQELINYYLHRKVKYLPLPQNVIKEIQLYKYNPWDLPRRALYGENEWYFFTPRDRKYPNGGRPNRTTESGYWKATGTDKPILSSSKSKQIGVKKTLVFYMGKPPSRQKMDWVMTEYRLPDASRPSRAKGSMRLDDWVICRIRQKGNMSKNAEEELDTENHSSDELLDYVPMHEDLPPLHNENYNRGKDILSDHLRSSQHRELARLLIGDGKIEDSQTPIFSTFGNVIGASQDGQMSTTAMAETTPDEQRGMTYCPLEDNNLRASFRTNYTYWLNVYQGNVVNPSYGTNSYCNMAGGLDMPALY